MNFGFFCLLSLLFLGLFTGFTKQANAPLSGDSFVTEIPTTGISTLVTVIQDSEDRLFVKGGNTIYRSLDQGNTWTTVKTDGGSIAGYTLFVAANDDIYAILTEASNLRNIWRSTNHGDTWIKVQSNIGSPWHMTQAPNGTLYINNYGSATDKIWYSHDGTAWNSLSIPSGYDHIHWVEASPNTGYVYVATGDAYNDAWVLVNRWDGSGWVTLSNASDMQVVPIFFDDNYVYFVPDGSYNLRRCSEVGLTDIRSQGKIVFNLQDTYWAAGNFFYDMVYSNGIYVGGTDAGQLWASWDGERWVKVEDYGTLSGIFSFTRQGYPTYFVDKELNKLYRLTLTKEDVIRLYYSGYNAKRGLIANAENFVLEQRIRSGTSNYLDLTSVALSNVQASIKGLSQNNLGNNNMGFEWNNLTGWTTVLSGGGKISVDGTTAANGTYSLKVLKSAAQSDVTRIRNPNTVTVAKGDILTLSFYAKANTMATSNGFAVNFLNGTSATLRTIYYNLTTSWARYELNFVVPTSTNYPTMSYDFQYAKLGQTTWVDSVIFYVDQTSFAYGSAGTTYESVAYLENRTTAVIGKSGQTYKPNPLTPPFFNGSLDTQNPSLTVAGQTVSHGGTLTNGTASAPTSLTGILTGAVSVTANIQGSGQAILRLVGTRVLYEDSIILQTRKDTVYYGRYYGTFSPIITTNDLIAVTNLQANITSLTYTSNKLTLVVDSSSGTTSATKVYCGNKEEPKNVSNATSWNYDFESKVLTVIALHSSSVNLGIRWKLLGDVNDDGIVDRSDLSAFSGAFGSSGGPPPSVNWNSKADINRDNSVNVSDLYILGKNYGQSFLGDINDDGMVDRLDLSALSEAFGSSGGPPPSVNWNSKADINRDNNISISDLQILGKNYGK